MKLPWNKGKEVAVAKPAQKPLVTVFAERYHVEPTRLLSTLKMTVFKPSKNTDPEVTNEQMMALLVVANEHGLNPFTREIYAFPQNGGIVPIVSIDGWIRIINSHPQFDGQELIDNFDDNGNLESVTCKIYRKDRKHPTVITEWLSECQKPTEPWRKWPARMLRHKAMIQCARYAFGFAGIYDPDEADRIAEGDTEAQPSRVEKAMAGLPDYPDNKFQQGLPSWEKLIKDKSKTAADIISTIESKYTLSPEQKNQIENLEAIEGEVITESTTEEN